MSRQVISLSLEVEINEGDATSSDIVSLVRRLLEDYYPEAIIDVEVDWEESLEGAE